MLRTWRRAMRRLVTVSPWSSGYSILLPRAHGAPQQPQNNLNIFKGLGICLKNCFKRFKQFKHFFKQISNSVSIFKLFGNCPKKCLNCLAADRPSCREAHKTYLLSYVLTCPPTCTCIHVCALSACQSLLLHARMLRSSTACLSD